LEKSQAVVVVISTVFINPDIYKLVIYYEDFTSSKNMIVALWSWLPLFSYTEPSFLPSRISVLVYL